MKIVCDNCSAKYSIADDKVAGKVFKIRCKRCESVIVVRGDGGPEEESTRVHDYESEAIWHIVVEGEQQGPMTPIQLVALFARGALDVDSYAWREGFDDWKTIRDIPELSQMVEGVAARQPQGPETAPPPAQADDAPDQDEEYDIPSASEAPTSLGSTFDMDAAFGASPEAAAAAPAEEQSDGLAAADLFGQAATAEPSTDVFGEVPAEQPAAAAASPSVDPSQPMTGQRNENSVLFSLDNLQALAGKSGSAAPAAVAAPSSNPEPSPDADASGLIDIRALAKSSASVSTASAGSNDAEADVFTASAAPSSALGAPILAPVAEDPQKNQWKMWAVLGTLVAAIAVLGTWVFIQGRGQQDAQVAQAVDTADTQPAAQKPAAAPAVEEPVPAAQQPVAEAPTVDPTPTTKRTSKRKTTKRPSTTTKTTTTEKPARKSNSIDALMNEVLGSEGGSSSKPAAKEEPASTSGGSGPATPSRSEVGRALAGVSGAVKACGKGESGTATVSVTFSGSTGRVKSANVVSGPFKGTPAASCISSAVKRARVSRFTQSSFNVKYPYRL